MAPSLVAIGFNHAPMLKQGDKLDERMWANSGQQRE